MKLFCFDVLLLGVSLDVYQFYFFEEVCYVWYLYKMGFVCEILFCQDCLGVVIIVESDLVDVVRQVFVEFLLVKVGLIDWEIILFGLFVGWELLFVLCDV